MALVSCIMWLTSYFYYTSIGIDSEYVDHQQDESSNLGNNYYRVRWPGNGSLWIGGGRDYSRLEIGKTPQRFDLAGTFFQSPRRLESKSVFNMLGFWWINENRQTWIGVPAGLPAILLGLWIFRCIRSRVHSTN